MFLLYSVLRFSLFYGFLIHRSKCLFGTYVLFPVLLRSKIHCQRSYRASAVQPGNNKTQAMVVFLLLLLRSLHSCQIGYGTSQYLCRCIYTFCFSSGSTSISATLKSHELPVQVLCFNSLPYLYLAFKNPYS